MRGYSISVLSAMVSKISDLLKDLVFTLPCMFYEINDYKLRPLVATVSAYTVSLRSPAFQAYANEDTVRRLKMDIEKVWKNHRTQRRLFLATHLKREIEDEDDWSLCIYDLLLGMCQVVPHSA